MIKEYKRPLHFYYYIFEYGGCIIWLRIRLLQDISYPHKRGKLEILLVFSRLYMYTYVMSKYKLDTTQRDKLPARIVSA